MEYKAVENTTKPIQAPAFLEFMPVSLFGSVMGFSALCFAWRSANRTWHYGAQFAEAIGYMAILTFVVLTIAYILKWIRYPASVAREFKSSVTIGFFSTVSISILLIPGILLPYAPVAAYAIWLLGVVLTIFSAWYVLRKWLDEQQPRENAVPAWVLPVTGTLNVPIVGSAFNFAGAHEICVLFFGIGIIFIIIMYSLIFSRLFFETPLPAAIQPSLFILVAPMSLAFNGYEGMIGGQDLMASTFFYFSLFLLLLFGSKLLLLPRCCPFQVSWWSVSFPLGAVTTAALRYAQMRPDAAHWTLAALLLAVSTVVVLYLLVQTIYQIGSRTFGRLPVGKPLQGLS